MMVISWIHKKNTFLNISCVYVCSKMLFLAFFLTLWKLMIENEFCWNKVTQLCMYILLAYKKENQHNLFYHLLFCLLLKTFFVKFNFYFISFAVIDTFPKSSHSVVDKKFWKRYTLKLSIISFSYYFFYFWNYIQQITYNKMSRTVSKRIICLADKMGIK